MLTLGIQNGHYVMIGDDIKVMVKVDNHGNIRLSIDAPSDMKILRDELYEQKQANK